MGCSKLQKMSILLPKYANFGRVLQILEMVSEMAVDMATNDSQKKSVINFSKNRLGLRLRLMKLESEFEKLEIAEK